ncbi:hypothetical protein BJ741DRAFT_704471 [Chytriomyces cf. hyalinus JEL632]|nr:hypothetical protein BJ741DRAFT_704471 [Chytriomyces cf. hyalinus JEL632]
MSATQPPARATAPPNKRVLALGARANITAATRTAPKTSLSSTDKKATTEKRDASKASIRPLRTTTQPTTAVRKPASTSRTAAKVPIRSSTALPRARIPIPATSASTKPRPVKRVASTSQNDDDFGACDISHILDADSAKDLDVRDASLSLGGRSAAAGRRATNFAGSSEPDKKRASIYAGPVRVIKKNPNATIPIMPVFSNQHPQIARRNVAAIRQHMEVEDAPIQLQKTKSTLKREELERSEPKTLAKNEAVDNDGAEEVASLPDTPSRTISRPTGPKRVLRANPQQPTEINTPHRETLKTTSGGGNLADAIAKASLFRANSLPIHQQISSASAAGSVQIVQTPRRIIDQKKAREFGMAVMDLDFPSPIRVAPKGGQLFHKPSDSPGLFKPIGTPRRVKSSSISLSNIENEMPQKSSLVSQGKPLIPQVERASSATGTDRPRMLLPNPFEVLGIAQPLKTSLRDNEPEHPKTNLNETKAETSQLGGVDLLPHDQSKAAVETNQVSWKKVSPRRSDESAISAGGDYRSGVRAAASVSTLSNSQTSHSPLAVSNDSANLNLHDLEAQFRQIAGQLLNRGASNGQATENVLPDSKLNVKSCASNGSLENSSTNSEAVAASAILPSVFDWQASLTRDGNGGVGTGNSEITENDNDHVESEAADDMKHAQNNINGVVEKQPKDDTYADQSMIDTALDELDEEEERVLMEIMKLNASIS